RDDGHDAAPCRSRSPRSPPPRSSDASPGGRVPLPPPADPRCRVRGAPQGSPSGPAPPLRGLDRGTRGEPRRAGRDPRLPPRAGGPVPRGARTTGSAAGRRARHRGDGRAARALLERSLALTRAHRLDLHLEAALARTHIFRDTPKAIEVAEAAAARAEVSGDEASRAFARTLLAAMRLHTGQTSADEAEKLAREAIPLLEAAHDDEALMHVWLALSVA